MNILIVDDEDIIRKSVIKTIELSELEFQNIFEAGDAYQALEILEKTENNIQIVIMDINMPHINGLDLTKIIKSKNEKITVGIISGYDYYEYMREAIKLGVDDYILKPTTKQDIISLLRNLMDISAKKIQLETVSSIISSKLNDELYSEDKMLKIVEEYIFQNEFSLSFLAEKMDLSTNYLSNVFKKKYGLTFQDYVLKRRMEKAVLLLASTNLKNYEIAEQIGYDSVYYFNIKFKKYYELTPKEYKKKLLVY